MSARGDDTKPSKYSLDLMSTKPLVFCKSVISLEFPDFCLLRIFNLLCNEGGKIKAAVEVMCRMTKLEVSRIRMVQVPCVVRWSAGRPIVITNLLSLLSVQ